MKLLFFGLMFLSQLALAAEVKEFNRTLIEGVKKDIQSENDDAFKKKEPQRGPASVGSTHPTDLPKDEQRIEKMNIKQLGPSKW